MTDALRTVALLGLGRMGLPMARNLAKAGLLVSVFNRTRRAWDLPEGVRVAETPRDAARGADAVLTIVTGEPETRAVWFGVDGAARSDADGRLFVDMSTSGRAAALRLHAELSKRGARFVDAPVSGTRRPAERAELVVLAGGARDDVRALRPAFDAIGRKTVHAGPVGSGQTLKTVLNGMGCQHLLAFASMLRLGERAGLSRELLVETFSDSAFATPAYRGKAEQVRRRDYASADFVLELAERDARLCHELAESVDMSIPTHRAARIEVQRAIAAGWGDADLFAVEHVYDDDE